jgi:hypothetical protein
MLIRLLQSFSSITLHPEAQHPDTLPPADWAHAEGRKSRERFWPKAHLTIYAYVLCSPPAPFSVLTTSLIGRSMGPHD